MSLNGFEGPGTMFTFLSGNFGSAGQQVFNSRSGGYLPGARKHPPAQQLGVHR